MHVDQLLSSTGQNAWPTTSASHLYPSCQSTEDVDYRKSHVNSTGRHGHFLRLTCDMEPIDMRIHITDMTQTIP